MTDGDFNEKLHALDRRLSIHEISQAKDLAAVEKARELQAIEYSRRLEILNGEASRLRDIQATYVPRELYEQRHDEIGKAITELRRYRDTNLGRQAVIATIIPVIISLLFLWLNKH